jgi:hypothetical protein
MTRTFGLGTGPNDLGPDPAARAGYADHPALRGFFTYTSVCTGRTASEVACKEWTAVPEDGLLLSGMSYNNTAYLSASTGGTEAFIEQSAVARQRAGGAGPPAGLDHNSGSSSQHETPSSTACVSTGSRCSDRGRVTRQLLVIPTTPRTCRTIRSTSCRW